MLAHTAEHHVGVHRLSNGQLLSNSLCGPPLVLALGHADEIADGDGLRAWSDAPSCHLSIVCARKLTITSLTLYADRISRIHP